MKKRYPSWVLIIILVALTTPLAVFFYKQKHLEASSVSTRDSTPILSTKKTSPYSIKKIEVSPGKTYGELIREAGIKPREAREIYEVALPFYDLAGLNAGRNLNLYFSKNSGELKKFSYRLDSEEKLVVQKTETATSSDWRAQRKKIPYKTKQAFAQGQIKTSLYTDGQENGLDVETIIKLANAFQWTIDFAMETQKGDSFKLIYEKRYLDGEYVMPGKILAAQYINAGKKHEIYYYEESKDNQGYFTPEGKSAQKMFLKAPVSYKYISSGFTHGPRYLAKFKMFTSSHRAIDYAASVGTPIRSVGDGTVTRAGWSSAGYGYLTTVRHNSTYTTRYAHQNRIIVSPGQKVKQGEVIGYVGNTGLSTGPHLHYEMIKYGSKINPLTEELPPSKSILKENLTEFKNYIKTLQKKLNS